MKLRLWALVCLLTALIALPASANICPPTPGNNMLRVGVIQSPPFVIHSADKDWHGISVDLWRSIAEKLQLPYILCSQDQHGNPLAVSNGLAEVQQQQLDLVLGALTVTSERETIGDFSLPFFRTGLAIATRPDSHAWDELWQWATKPTTLAVVIFLVIMAPLLALLIRRLERDHEQELLKGPRGHSFAMTVLWVTLLCTGRAGAFEMKSFRGRVLATILSFAGVTVLASLIALATSSTVMSNLDNQISDIKALTQHRVAVIKGTNVESFMAERGIKSQPMSDLNTALTALMANKVDAVIHDKPTLQYAILMLPADQRPKLHNQQLNEEFYSIYLQQQSPLREPINRQIPNLLMDNDWQLTMNRYLGAQ